MEALNTLNSPPVVSFNLTGLLGTRFMSFLILGNLGFGVQVHTLRL